MKVYFSHGKESGPWGPKIKRLDLIKITLLTTATAISAPWYLRRVDEIESAMGVAFLGGLFVLCLVAVLAAAFSRYHAARVVYALFMTASALVVESYRAIVDELFSYDAYVTIVQAIAFADNVAFQFPAQMAKAALIGVLLLIGILLPPRAVFTRRRGVAPVCAVIPLTVILAFSVILYGRGGSGVKGLPSSIVALPYAVVRVYEYIQFDRGNREQVSIPHRADSAQVDVILIIDESVRGDYLDINGGEGLTSSLARDDGSTHNFALAASATNCSGGSNVILRFGGTRDGYHRAMNTQPSIWAYARAAGLKTVYLDAQRTNGRMQNFMYDEEAQEIEQFQQFGDTDLLHRDLRIAEIISELTHNDIPELIVANKLGAHFPVHDKYPDTYMRYTPVSRRGEYADVTDTGDKSGFDGDWERYRNSYRNTILWNVGEFFRIIFESADLERSFVIYTSDHGQDFHEDGSPGVATHCSFSPSPNQGLVPMVVVTRDSKWAGPAATWSESNRNHTSHFNIFPTLLLAMGYEGDVVRERYGPSLFEPTGDLLTFISRFDRFGRAPRWTKIEVPQGP